MTLRKGIRERLGRRKRPRNRLEGVTERTRDEARKIERRQRDAHQEAIRQARARAFRARTESMRVRLRGAALETRRRLRPFWEPARRLIGRVAPHISRGLLFVLRMPVALVAFLLQGTENGVGWLRNHGAATAAGVAAYVSTHVTPRRTVALVGAFAALALGASQFFDYHAVKVNSLFYEGEVGTVAPAPRTNAGTAGGAHLYVLLPVAIAALAMIWATYTGRRQGGRIIALLGVVGIAVSLIVDLPQGLDTGLSGIAYEDSQAELIEGFWAQLAASCVLVLCGLLLNSYQRGESVAGAGRLSPPRARPLWKRKPRTPDTGAVAPRWSAEP